MRLKLEARPEPSRLMGWLSPVLAAGLTVVAGFILFSALAGRQSLALQPRLFHRSPSDRRRCREPTPADRERRWRR